MILISAAVPAAAAVVVDGVPRFVRRPTTLRRNIDVDDIDKDDDVIVESPPPPLNNVVGENDKLDPIPPHPVVIRLYLFTKLNYSRHDVNDHEKQLVYN